MYAITHQPSPYNMNRIGLSILISLLAHAVVLLAVYTPKKIAELSLSAPMHRIGIQLVAMPRPAVASKEKKFKHALEKKKIIKHEPSVAKIEQTIFEEKTEPVKEQAAPNQPVADDGLPIFTQANYADRSYMPQYPSRAREMGQQGTTYVRALVSASGQTERVIIVRSSGFNLLDMAAKDAVQRWKFKPSSLAGRPVASWIEQPVAFRLVD